MGGLTTHVLDTACGCPAAGVRVELLALQAGEWLHVADTMTNADGRTGAPLLEGARLEPGCYELRFHAGDYLRRRGVELPDPAFLDVIPIRFGVAEAGAHVHVPLLLSPYGYSTYRGS